MQPGDVLNGKYRVLESLGDGGMGEVYLALRLGLEDKVVVKRLRPDRDSPESRANFLLEARAAAHVRHPNVVEIFDFGDPQGTPPYMVMEYLEGETLRTHLDRVGPLDLERVLKLLVRIAAAIEAGHRRGVIHRDIKPGNVMLTQSDDGRERVKVLDFGIAHMQRGDSRNSASHSSGASNMLVGTVEYMAPEQALGVSLSPRSDVFALGVLTYEMLAGQTPFHDESRVKTLVRIAQGDYVPLAERLSDAPERLCRAIDAALSHDPSERPPSAEAFARIAGAYVAPRGSAVPPAPTRRGDKTASAADSNQTIAAHGRLSLFSFVGRDHQLAALEHARQGALAGEGRMTLISGAPGLGKTKLVSTFAESVAQEGGVARQTRFFAHASQAPRYEAFLRLLAETPPAIETALAEGDRWSVFAAIADGLVSEAVDQPLVLIFDDVHLATGDELELLEHVYRCFDGGNAQLILTADLGALDPPGYFDAFCGRLRQSRSLTTLELHPFDREQIRHWLTEVFGRIRIAPLDLERLHELSGGVPQHLVEIVRHLADRGVIHADEHVWTCEDLTGAAVPESLSSLLADRLATLDKPLLGLLRAAAVIGDQFDFATLAQVTAADQDELDAGLDQAIRGGFLVEEGLRAGAEFGFSSSGLRQAIYEGMSRRARMRAHKATAEVLEHRMRSPHRRGRPSPGALAHHRLALGEWDQAFQSSLDGAREALKRQDHALARTLIAQAGQAQQALESEGHSLAPGGQVAFDQLGGELDVRLGRFRAARRRLDRVLEHTDVGHPSRMAARVDLVRALRGMGELETAIASGYEAISEASHEGNRRQQLWASVVTVGCLTRHGDVDEAAELLDRVLELVDDDDPPTLRSVAHRERAWLSIKLGDFSSARDHADRAIRLARDAGDLPAQALALGVKSCMYGESGNLRAAISLGLRALDLARRLGLRHREAVELANLGENYLDLGEHERCIRFSGEALDIFDAIGDKACVGDCSVNLGRALVAAGRTDEARKTLERGRTICQETGRFEYIGIARVAEGQLAFDLDDLEGAKTAFEDARETFARMEHHLLWQAYEGLARVAAREGRADEAETLTRLAEGLLRTAIARIPEGNENELLESALQRLR